MATIIIEPDERARSADTDVTVPAGPWPGAVSGECAPLDDCPAPCTCPTCTAWRDDPWPACKCPTCTEPDPPLDDPCPVEDCPRSGDCDPGRNCNMRRAVEEEREDEDELEQRRRCDRSPGPRRYLAAGGAESVDGVRVRWTCAAREV